VLRETAAGLVQAAAHSNPAEVAAVLGGGTLIVLGGDLVGGDGGRSGDALVVQGAVEQVVGGRGDQGSQCRRLPDGDAALDRAAVSPQAEAHRAIEQGEVVGDPGELEEGGGGVGAGRREFDLGDQSPAAVQAFAVVVGQRQRALRAVEEGHGGVEGQQQGDDVAVAAPGQVAADGGGVAQQRGSHAAEHLRQHPVQMGGEAGVLQHVVEGGRGPHREAPVLAEVAQRQGAEVHQRRHPDVGVADDVGAAAHGDGVLAEEGQGLLEGARPQISGYARQRHAGTTLWHAGRRRVGLSARRRRWRKPRVAAKLEGLTPRR
jgi:hypothetical protein